MEHIETIELDSSQASITFSSIPQDYDDLVIFCNLRGDATAGSGGRQKRLRVNALGSTNSGVELFGDGTAKSRTLSAIVWESLSSDMTANTFGNTQIYISNYKSSTDKSVSMDATAEENGTSLFITSIIAGLIGENSAITSITLDQGVTGDLVSGSIASLYGVTAGGDGTVTSA